MQSHARSLRTWAHPGPTPSFIIREIDPMKSQLLLGSIVVLVIVVFAAFVTAATPAKKGTMNTQKAATESEHISKTDAEWKQQLTPEQYRVLRQKGTEIAFTGKYWNNHAKGAYLCAACGYE